MTSSSAQSHRNISDAEAKLLTQQLEERIAKIVDEAIVDLRCLAYIEHNRRHDHADDDTASANEIINLIAANGGAPSWLVNRFTTQRERAFRKGYFHGYSQALEDTRPQSETSSAISKARAKLVDFVNTTLQEWHIAASGTREEPPRAHARSAKPRVARY